MNVELNSKHVSRHALSVRSFWASKQILSKLECPRDESKNWLVFEVPQASWFVS